MCTDWLKIGFLQLDGDTELAQTVDVMMAQAKRTYILIIKVNELFSFFWSWCFIKETKNIFSVFLSSYRNTRKVWENSKAVETPACDSCSHSVSCSPKLALMFV